MSNQNSPPPAMFDPEAFYRSSQVVSMLGLSAKSLGTAIKHRRLRSTQIGPNRLFKGQWLIDWLESESVNQTKPA